MPLKVGRSNDDCRVTDEYGKQGREASKVRKERYVTAVAGFTLPWPGKVTSSVTRTETSTRVPGW